MPKPRIAILATSLVPPHPAGTQILEVIDRLSSEYDFTVYAREVDAKLQGKIIFKKIPIPLCKPLILRYLVQYFLYAWLVKRHRLLEEYDIVHSIEATSPYATVTTMHFCGDAAKLLMRSGELKYKGWRKFYYPILNVIGTAMERRMVKNSNLKDIIVVSKGLKKNVLTHYKDVPDNKVKVIYNFANLDKFVGAKAYREEVRCAYGLTSEDLVGVIVALGDWQRKGLDILIDAIKLKKNTGVKIFVIGGGPIYQYQKICKDKGVEKNFIFLGFQISLERFYGAADFFIFPSAFEAFPLVLLEASAAGLPILASEIDGTKEIVEDGINGLLFKRTSRDIANKLEMIIADKSLLGKFSRNASGKSKVYTIENMVDQYRLYYRDAAANK